MRRIGWGRRIRAALKAQGFSRASKAEIVAGLRQSAASMGAQAADIFWSGMQQFPNVPPAVRDAVALDISAEIDAAIRLIMKEWRIPRSAESERLAEMAEASFKERLSALAAAGGAS